MSDLLELTQKHCAYQITAPFQKLDFNFDIETLRREIFNFIINNNFGYQTVSLRLPEGNNDYTSKFEYLESGGTQAFIFRDDHNYEEVDKNTAQNNRRHVNKNETRHSEYIHWHPMLKDSYLATLVPNLEKLCGLKIGKIRLGWLMPDSGYPLHYDLEPLRLHIPIITNNNAYMIHDQEVFHMQYGNLYHLITTNVHTAWNFGCLPRLHLVFSTYIDDQIDIEINKLEQIDVKKQNLNQQLLNSGVDQYTINQLLNICNGHYSEVLNTLDDITKILFKK